MDKYTTPVEKETPTDLGPYPTVNNFILRFEKIVRDSKADFAPSWFLDLIEKPQKEEAPRVVRRKDSTCWEWPYEVRVIVLFRKYMKCDEVFKQFIIAAKEDGVYWRGDNPKFFYKVVNENERMREMGVESYRKEVSGEMRRFLAC